MPLDISVVIPLYNEEESLPELVAWIERVCAEHHYTHEVILVDDGSTDHKLGSSKDTGRPIPLGKSN